jgi:hypothetical protein
MSTPAEPSRTLHVVPIIHTEADLGQLRDAVVRATIGAQGPDAWLRKQTRVAEYWERIEAWAERLTVTPALRLFQDGLPVCGREREIIADLARQGSRNHRLLESLIARGAQVVGTESPELLLEEYRAVKRAAERGEPGLDKAPGDSLLEKRDRFIAERIDRTLEPGLEGVLFIGMLHHVQRFLPGDVRVVEPMTGPSLATGQGVRP